MLTRILFLVAATLPALTACISNDTVSVARYRGAVARADENFMLDRRKCERFAGDAKDLCITEAKAVNTKMIASAKAEHLATAKARIESEREMIAADYSLAREKCNSFAGEFRRKCIMDAKDEHKKAEQEIDQKEKEFDQEWRAAVARCSELGGTYRSTCMAEARAKYGR